MIKIHFLGDGNKPCEIDLHEGIIKSFSFISNSLVIEFKRSVVTLPDKKKHMAPGFTNWTWTKNVNDILNYNEVMAFLKWLPLDGKIKATDPITNKEDNQQSLF